MDDADKATDLEEARTAAAMARIASQLKTVNLDIHCEDCGKEIPEARRKAVPYATRCIMCQEKDDKITKGVRRL
jgi:phage/conjugal plasmid C-4 type zinc finger TraR family protein